MRIHIYTRLIAKKIFCRTFDIHLENGIIIIEVGKEPTLILKTEFWYTRTAKQKGSKQNEAECKSYN